MARLPQINRASAIAPVSLPSVTVSTGDPLNTVLAAGYGNLATRIDSLRNTIQKAALKEGEVAGLASGVTLTTKLLDVAKLTGKPVTLEDLPGDPSSISVVEQAARKGALAVVTSRYAVEGRKAITALVLEAASDPDMSPDVFKVKLNDIVENRTNALANISPTSAVKLQSTLSIVANSAGVSQARSFYTRQQTIQKAEAIASIPVFQSNINGIIAGYRQLEGEPGLKERIDTEVEQLTNYLITQGVAPATVAASIKAVRKAIVGQKIAVIKNYVRDSTNNNIAGVYSFISQLEAPGRKVDHPNIGALFESLDDVGKNKAIDDLRTLHSNLVSMDKNNEQNIIDRRKLVIFDMSRSFFSHLDKGERGAAGKVLDQIKRIDRDVYNNLFKVWNEGSVSDTPNSPVVREYQMQMLDKREDVTDMWKAIAIDPDLSAGEKLILGTELRNFQDEKFKRALAIAKREIDIEPSEVKRLGKDASSEQRRLLAIFNKFAAKMHEGMLDPSFDPIMFNEIELPKIKISETTFILDKLQRSILRRTTNIPESKNVDLDTIKGLEAFNDILKIYKSKKDSKGRLEFNTRILNAAQDKITDAIEAVIALKKLGAKS